MNKLIPVLMVLLSAALAQSIQLTPVVNGLSHPLFLTYASDNPERMYILQQNGTIRVLQNNKLLPEPFLDVSKLISCCGERGLLGLAFHPKYKENGWFFINYTNTEGNTVVARYEGSPGRADPARADPNSAKILFTVEQPYANHNGGMIAFGPDGMLYIGMGDGGSGGDPQGFAQNLKVLQGNRHFLGKLLRIDVNKTEGSQAYGIPSDNPTLGGRRSEIWSYGWRNPWRFSFDRQTGDLWAGDVGQGEIEEVDFQPVDSKGGESYGWNLMEGGQCYRSTNCSRDGLVLPVLSYNHSVGQSITGGYRYRGKAMPAFQGQYFYADYVSGRIWAATPQGNGWQSKEILASGLNISSFSEDAAGELYVLDYRGSIFKMTQK